MIKIEDLYAAYYDCRKHKRGTLNALEFEMDYESNLRKLREEINNGTYQIGRSMCFVVTKPKLREVFAADFRDRVVHHFVIRKIEPMLESNFIDDTYNCRKGKGVQYGLKRLRDKVQEAIGYYGYNPDLCIAKFDCKGFFMSIDKEVLRDNLSAFVEENYSGDDREDIIRLLRQIIMHDPTKNCYRKSKMEMWEGLSWDKSLFHLRREIRDTYRQSFKPGAGEFLFNGV